MKRSFLLILSVSIYCVSCRSDKDKSSEKDLNFDSVTAVKADTVATVIDAPYFWSAEQEGTKGLVMKRLRPISSDSLSAEHIVEMLNQQYPEVKLEVTGTAHDTLQMQIRNAKYLTQQMGSTGAEAYLAEVTYNLTEVKGINFVKMRFKEGDHATPGTYARTDFVK